MRRPERVQPRAADLLAALSAETRRRLGDGADAFEARAVAHLPDAIEALDAVYGEHAAAADVTAAALGQVLGAAERRGRSLQALDHRREIEPDWFQRSSMLGYVCYVDRYAGTLPELRRHLDHLTDLGVTYLHLMPLLRTRPGPDDGGYAVSDYRSVEPALGTMDDLEALAGDLRERGISLCVDVVVNHTAYEHAWAESARSGDADHRQLYRVFDDRHEPDAFEATTPEVFPTFAPGSFTWDDDLRGWVWTTFHPFQWDFNHANPAVFTAMLDVMLDLANRGAEVLRLDAVPFIWKRLGTNSQNQPEAHRLVQAWRALVRIAAPAVLFKAEAIVAPDELVGYLGGHDRFRPECDLAYHNQLMVSMWSALATKDARLTRQALSRMSDPPPTTSWCTYVRCHDDIGWAISDTDAAAVGFDGPSHRRFLADYYAGRYPGSPATGADFQSNPATGDVRTSGSAASLAGVESAAGDPAAVARAVDRLVLLHSVAFSFGGIPLLYMGDELAMVNDHGYLEDPDRADDNRWMHRPRMKWAASRPTPEMMDWAASRSGPGTTAGVVHGWIGRLAAARRALPTLHAGAPARLLDAGDDRVLAYRRRHRRHGPFVALVNVSESTVAVAESVLAGAGLRRDQLVLAGAALDDLSADGTIGLPGLGFAWFAELP